MTDFPIPVVPIVLGASVLWAGWLWLRSLFEARLSEDTPRARIRSAAQGHVELVGTTRMPAGDVIVSPLSGTRCVWWSYSVRWSENKDGREQEVIKTETSHKYFFIEDATGRCRVNPEDAEVQGAKTVTWYSHDGTLAGATAPVLGLNFGKYKCSESLIPENVSVFVLGKFQTVRKASQPLDRMREELAAWRADPKRVAMLDANHDGRLDERELEAARRAALLEAQRETATEIGTEDFVGKPDDGRPFVIGAGAREAFAKRERAIATRSLAWFLGGGLVLIWLLRILFHIRR